MQRREEGGAEREREREGERERMNEQREGEIKGAGEKLSALWPTCFARSHARHAGDRAGQDLLHTLPRLTPYHASRGSTS